MLHFRPDLSYGEAKLVPQSDVKNSLFQRVLMAVNDILFAMCRFPDTISCLALNGLPHSGLCGLRSGSCIRCWHAEHDKTPTRRMRPSIVHFSSHKIRISFAQMSRPAAAIFGRSWPRTRSWSSGCTCRFYQILKFGGMIFLGNRLPFYSPPLPLHHNNNYSLPTPLLSSFARSSQSFEVLHSLPLFILNTLSRNLDI